MHDLFSASSAHLCAVDLEEAGPHLARLRGFLAPEETERAGRFRYEADRSRFMLGRAMIRRICSLRLRITPGDVRLGQSVKGKPALISPAPPLHFNVSHSGSRVLMAWSVNGPLGVDVEALDRRLGTSFAELAAAAFSTDECRVLESSPLDFMAKVFFSIWTRKEALLKAEGCGLGTDTKAFSVVVPGDSKQPCWLDAASFGRQEQLWQMREISTDCHHAAAVAMKADSTISTHTPANLGLW